MGAASTYYVPHEARWPIVGSVGLMALFCGLAMTFNGTDMGSGLLGVGVAIMIIMMFGWFATVIKESESGPL